MISHLKYLRYLLRHKWFVFTACCREGLIWRGLIHDWSKFTPAEWFAYVHFFYPRRVPFNSTDPSLRPSDRDSTGYYKPTDTGDAAFDFAWLMHQKRNDHHWQWWVLPEDDGAIKTLPMSDRARREMICDWKGAGLAQGKPDTLAWYAANRGKMKLHPDTREWVEAKLGYQPPSS
jgi:Family of unknown function (DUF5662)